MHIRSKVNVVPGPFGQRRREADFDSVTDMLQVDGIAYDFGRPRRVVGIEPGLVEPLEIELDRLVLAST